MRTTVLPICFPAIVDTTRLPSQAPTSPCVRNCRIGQDGLCGGCLRSLDEIARWSVMGEDERQQLMDGVLPERERARFAFLGYLPERAHLHAVLYPLRQPPAGESWNRAELDDFFPPSMVPAEAAVLVGLVPRGDAGTQVLLTRRTDALRHHGGQVSFPGGRVEPHDAGVLGAALRESDEEIALGAAQVVPLGYLDPILTISGFRVTPVVAAIDQAYVPRPDPGEVADVFEVPLQFLMSATNLRQVEVHYSGRARSLLEYDWPAQRIWGVTASILYNLRRRLEQGGM